MATGYMNKQASHWYIGMCDGLACLYIPVYMMNQSRACAACVGMHVRHMVRYKYGACSDDG